jgi:hypothetical protein
MEKTKGTALKNTKKLCDEKNRLLHTHTVTIAGKCGRTGKSQRVNECTELKGPGHHNQLRPL